MNKIFFFGLFTQLFLFPLLSTGQISISENKTTTAKVGYYKYSDFNKGNCTYSIDEKNDTAIVLCCLDQRYPSLQQYGCISFKGGSKELNQLYDALIGYFTQRDPSRSV